MKEQHFSITSSLPHVLLSLSGQVVVPEELRFPQACCVGIASQTSLSLFNPSERWQQVSITVTSMAVDGEKVGKEHQELKLPSDYPEILKHQIP